MSNAKNINEVSVITSVDSGDYVMVSDISDDSLKRATVTNVGKELLGTTDISSIGDGSVTGAISTLNSGAVLKKTFEFELNASTSDKWYQVLSRDVTVSDTFDAIVTVGATRYSNTPGRSKVFLVHCSYSNMQCFPISAENTQCDWALYWRVASDGTNNYLEFQCGTIAAENPFRITVLPLNGTCIVATALTESVATSVISNYTMDASFRCSTKSETVNLGDSLDITLPSGYSTANQKNKVKILGSGMAAITFSIRKDDDGAIAVTNIGTLPSGYTFYGILSCAILDISGTWSAAAVYINNNAIQLLGSTVITDVKVINLGGMISYT